MFCLFSNIFFCGYEEINLLNLSNFSYVLNCIEEYNNFLSDSNYININLNSSNLDNVAIYEEIYKWLESNSNTRIIILDYTGYDYSMQICMYLIMKLYNRSFLSIYEELSKITTLAEKSYYKFLQINEMNIIKKHFDFTNKKTCNLFEIKNMDTN